MQETRRTEDSQQRHRLRLVADLDRYASRRGLWRDDSGEGQRYAHLHGLLRDALAAALTEKQRHVVHAFFYQGLSQGQIAKDLGISQQVVQKTLYGAQRRGKLVGGALAKLRTYLREVCPQSS